MPQRKNRPRQRPEIRKAVESNRKSAEATGAIAAVVADAAASACRSRSLRVPQNRSATRRARSGPSVMSVQNEASGQSGVIAEIAEITDRPRDISRCCCPANRFQSTRAWRKRQRHRRSTAHKVKRLERKPREYRRWPRIFRKMSLYSPSPRSRSRQRLRAIRYCRLQPRSRKSHAMRRGTASRSGFTR